jgi:hypothetical protein
LYPAKGWEECPVTQYFLAALENAPKHPFFRRAVGGWYAFDDRDKAVQLMREVTATDDIMLPIDYGLREFAKFLYELQMDYESDQKAWRATLGMTVDEKAQSDCQPTIASQNQDSSNIELGTDDGSAEWSTPLRVETDRVKKVICLPEDIENYQQAKLLILASRGKDTQFTLRVGIDQYSVNLPGHLVFEQPTWMEIPLDMSALENASRIHVYIRMRGEIAAESAPRIWGDKQEHTTHSTFNFDQTRDLSPDDGKQRGEYLIRLALQRK